MSPAVKFSPISELARILVTATLSDIAEICSVESLSELAGLSRRAFYNRCQAAGIAGRDCLHFVQCLKAVLLSDGKHWDPAALIPVGDPRTLRKILMQARINCRERPTLATFVSCQEFCKSSWFKESVLRALEQAPASSLSAV